jgi:hypothetical protein
MLETPSQSVQPKIQIGHRAPRTSLLIVLVFVGSLFLLGLGYLVFIKPTTEPAAALFQKLFPPQSGILKLQNVELDLEGVVNNPVFKSLQEYGQPIVLPPLGKPNPFH